MSAIRRLLVVSTEDSTKLSSWSNVPFLFCENLEKKGIVLDRLTLDENIILRRLVSAAQKIFGFFGGGGSAWSYSRSAIYFRLARNQIDLALRQSNADAVLILNFSYGPTLPLRVPLFMFCDWSFGYAIECQRGRIPDEYEKRSIEREHNLIASADEVFVLFPLAERYLKNSRPAARTHYLGNVINAVVEPSLGDIAVKLTKQSLLFIGKPHYIEGANRLIAAYNNLKSVHPRLTLEIVGMDATFFDNLPDGVRCHGYLDKGSQSDCDKYYNLLRQARLYVNTTPGWASFSATLEALYFHTPIITSRYPEIVETVGEELNCGSYYDGPTYALEELIERYLGDDGFTLHAIRANEIASQYKWENYIYKFLEIIENTNKARRTEKWHDGSILPTN